MKNPVQHDTREPVSLCLSGETLNTRQLLTLIATLTILACSRQPDRPVPIAQATRTPAATATPASIATVPAPATPSPTNTTAPTVTLTPRITASPTPNPLEAYTIDGLRERDFAGGILTKEYVVEDFDVYTRYYVSYPSDDLTITGIMHVPKGQGPFPVVILNHGYIPPSRYWSGADTWRAADYLARRGYLTLAPDFRGWGGSDSGPNYFRTGLVIDILNAINSLESVPEADPSRVGMWGHSMGGGATTKSITVDAEGRIEAAVLYGPVSADDVEVGRRWGFRNRIVEDIAMQRAYYQTARDDEFLAKTSPVNYFEYVTASVQIHQGTADTSTPPRWAEAIRDGLQAAGKDVQYFTYEGQGHAFTGESWSLFMSRVADFYDEKL